MKDGAYGQLKKYLKQLGNLSLAECFKFMSVRDLIKFVFSGLNSYETEVSDDDAHRLANEILNTVKDLFEFPDIEINFDKQATKLVLDKIVCLLISFTYENQGEKIPV